MTIYEHTIEIARPVADVFAFATSAEAQARWYTFLTDTVPITPEPVGVGTRWIEVGQLLGTKLEVVIEYIAFERDRLARVKTISGPIPYVGTYRFTDLGGRTRFTLTAEAEPSRFFRLAQAVLDRRINREIEASLANLKDLLQAHVEHQVP